MGRTEGSRAKGVSEWTLQKNASGSNLHNGLGQPDSRLTMHPLYERLGRDEKERQACYRALFRSELDQVAPDDIRLAFKLRK